MKSKWLWCWILSLLVFCQPVFAANVNILDDTLYYGDSVFYSIEGDGYKPVTKITEGSILCHYSVIEKEQSDVAMLAALYKDGVMLTAQAKEKTVNVDGGAAYNIVVDVPSGSGYEIRLFLVNGLSVTSPMKKLEKLSEKDNAKDVTEFMLNNTLGRIDNIGNRISVIMPPNEDLSTAAPYAEVSAGAEYVLDGTDFSNPVHMTVTAEDKSTREYIIETAYDVRENSYDFEEFTVGESAESYDEAHWIGPISSDKDISEVIENKDGNNMLKLTDNSTAARADVRAANWNISAPFTLSFKISYCLPDGVTERSSVDDYSYCTLFATNDNNVNLNKTDFYFGAFEPVWSSNAFYFNYYKNGARTKSNVKIEPSAWYNITLKYYLGKDGAYYVDYTIEDEEGKITEFKENPSGRTETKLTGFYLVTSPGRRATVLVDDVYVKEDKSFGTESYEQNFENGVSDEWIGGTLANKGGSTVLAITDSGASAELPKFIGNTEVSFDFITDSTNQTGEILSFGTEDENIGTLCLNNGRLGYKKDGIITAFDDTNALEPGKAYRLLMDYVYDAVYENYRIDFYADGVKLGSVIPDSKTDSVEYLNFSSPNQDAVYIDNVLVEKL